MSKLYTVAILGATGAVGQEMIKVLQERNFPVGKLVPLASARSAGKTLKFKGIVARDGKIPDDTFVVGRHVMTCCADDVQYCGIACDWSGAKTLNTNDWVIVTVKFSIGNHKLYKSKGPILTALSVSRTSAPEETVATFY